MCRAAWVAQPQGWIVTADALNTQKGTDHKIRDQTVDGVLPVKSSYPYLQVQFSSVFTVLSNLISTLLPTRKSSCLRRARLRRRSQPKIDLFADQALKLYHNLILKE